jgi:hypothetical protein
LAMKGLVVWGNHFCRSFLDSRAVILQFITFLGLIIRYLERRGRRCGLRMMVGFRESPPLIVRSYGDHIV